MTPPPRVVLLLALQVLAPALKLGAGVLALYVARRLRAAAPAEGAARADGWWVAGAAMTLVGVSNAAQSVAAAAAVFAGPGSALYAAYLRAAPAGNQSRTVALIAAGALLAALAVRPARAGPRFRTAALGVLLAATAAGAALGWSEGTLEPGRHFTLKGSLDSVEMLSMLLALGLALAVHSMDRLLWLYVATYAFYAALNALWYVTLAMWGVPDAWSPNPLWAQVYAALLHTAMAATAWHRLALLRRGTPVPALLEAPVVAVVLPKL